MILGLDLGVKSVGLAVVDPRKKKVELTAVRVFPAGVEGDFESGKDSSPREAPPAAPDRPPRAKAKETPHDPG
jgi:hypothetical protein